MATPPPDPWNGPNFDEAAGRTQIHAPPSDSRVEKWKAWLKQIDEDVTGIYTNRVVWKTINEIVANHPDMPASHYFAIQAQNYATTQAVAVRRQAEVGGQVITLARLLAELAWDPQRMTRDRFVSMYPWGMQHIGDEEFDSFAVSGESHIDPVRLGQDQATLSTRCDHVRRYVNTRLAHFGETATPPPTFDDLDTAIDTLGSLFKRYTLLLEGADRRIEPVPQYDWLAPFRIAWIAD